MSAQKWIPTALVACILLAVVGYVVWWMEDPSNPPTQTVSVKGWAIGGNMLGLGNVKFTINGVTKTTMSDGYTSDGWNLVLGEAYAVTVVGPTGKTYTGTRTLYAASQASYYILTSLDSAYNIVTLNFIHESH